MIIYEDANIDSSLIHFTSAFNIYAGRWEIMITKNHKVKFFGGIQVLERESVPDIVSILIAKQTAHLLLLPEGLKVTSFLQSGCSKRIAENSEYIENVVGSSVIVLFREGYFYERKTSFLDIRELYLNTKDLIGNR